ncbi:HTH-type transcriptional repressor KstR [Nonomuraea coxensis DSM 45129]|uniref:HTH-type transcriptional repressor KstR n=1 Tax=Nonomuraea coxensis DSM 45129 TaxID=1122611 RepID=A0ABX8U9R5_9ACTN|nr:TetR/AcrR family transcriptional regulator [Nonomuraea coxensis]QYC44285.1 HTH-type transcriptional repressor KstR [Nonomuraea coxensis DSM 45129]
MSAQARESGALLRRAPVQQRSVERLDRIVDACAALLDEVGYEGLTTRAVARRAGVPIGSVYRFFHDKRDLVAALGERNMEEYSARLAGRLAGARRDWVAIVDLVVNEYVAMRRGVAGFATVDFGSSEALSGRLAALLAEHLGAPVGEDFRLALRIAVEACDAILRYAFRDDPAGDARVIAEAKELTQAYLARFSLE